MFIFNGEIWKVRLVPAFHPVLKYNNFQSIGACDDFSKTIYICDGLSPRKMKKVLCHEITHAAMFSYNVELSLEQEELIADLIATYGQEIINTTNKIFSRIKNKRGSY